ncbi:MAG: class I SAM-dependent methyltransferase [Deltaproteobacteria bacterium]|nr:MAG: class I SAM-dependent methyltransferase [Deltaproteobacteria bacterium]
MKQWLKIEKIPCLLASSYEKATRMVIESYYSPVADEIVSHMPDGKILDLGTGPGYLPIEIVKRSASLQIVGIDLSRKLIQMARVNALKAGVPNRLKFQVGNAARLSFDDSTFDMAISTGMLHALKDPIRVLREIYRVLKAGGEAWIYDPAKVASHIDIRKWKASLTFRERFFLWWFTLIRLHKPIETYSRAQVSAMIEATDFTDYYIEDEEDEIKIKLRK